jgi:hypothetical protein
MPDMSEYRLAPGSVLVALLVLGTAAADEPVGTGDYAYGWPIVTTGPAELYEVSLPIEVYQAAVDPQLRDLSVFDATGNPVPRLVRQPLQVVEEAEPTMTLPALPVWARPGQAPGDVRLRLERRGDATELVLDSAPATAAGLGTLVAYVVDTEETPRQWTAVDLEWDTLPGPLWLSVTVEGSEDLNQWFALGTGTVAALEQDGARIERRRIELPARSARYLRFTWREAPPEWQLSRVLLHWSAAPEAAPMERLRLQPAGRDPDDGGYLFDLGGSLLTREFALELPADNVVIGAKIYRQRPGSDRFETVHRGLFFHLRRDGTDAATAAVTVPPLRAARWKVVIERGRTEVDVSLVVGWQPDQVVFVAQGEPRWVLAAGSARDREQDFPLARRYGEPELAGLIERTASVAAATLGPRRVLGGEARLAPSPVGHWRQWLLWLGLTAGVALVAFMVLRLLRDLRAKA